jgi:hypothetical protein
MIAMQFFEPAVKKVSESEEERKDLKDDWVPM